MCRSQRISSHAVLETQAEPRGGGGGGSLLLETLPLTGHMGQLPHLNEDDCHVYIPKETLLSIQTLTEILNLAFRIEQK